MSYSINYEMIIFIIYKINFKYMIYYFNRNLLSPNIILVITELHKFEKTNILQIS